MQTKTALALLALASLVGCYQLPEDTDSGLDPDTDSTSDGGTDTATATDPGTDSDTATDPGTDSGTATDPGTDSGTATDPGTDSGTATDPGTQPGPVNIIPGDGCLGEPNLGTGSYRGTLAFNLNDIGSVPCVGSAAGRDGSVLVDVAPGQTLSVSYTSLSGDGVLYLLDSCPVVSTCLAGADSGSTGAETLSWTNNGSSTNAVHIVMDNYDMAGSGRFELEIDLF